MYFFLFYGAGIHDAGNSVQLKLWLLGYNDTLGRGLPPDPRLPVIAEIILPIFRLMYFYDEYLGHFIRVC